MSRATEFLASKGLINEAKLSDWEIQFLKMNASEAIYLLFSTFLSGSKRQSGDHIIALKRIKALGITWDKIKSIIPEETKKYVKELPKSQDFWSIKKDDIDKTITNFTELTKKQYDKYGSKLEKLSLSKVVEEYYKEHVG